MRDKDNVRDWLALFQDAVRGFSAGGAQSWPRSCPTAMTTCRWSPPASSSTTTCCGRRPDRCGRDAWPDGDPGLPPGHHLQLQRDSRGPQRPPQRDAARVPRDSREARRRCRWPAERPKVTALIVTIRDGADMTQFEGQRLARGVRPGVLGNGMRHLAANGAEFVDELNVGLHPFVLADHGLVRDREVFVDLDGIERVGDHGSDVGRGPLVIRHAPDPRASQSPATNERDATTPSS